ncbi:YeiH family protein [Rubrivirga sp. IMCC43871]|uniref:YeiH family protein n=1 Tax=Rubrivirga sp. IMCC43871 TaxID=3391575 RepID=UPI0039902F0B
MLAPSSLPDSTADHDAPLGAVLPPGPLRPHEAWHRALFLGLAAAALLPVVSPAVALGVGAVLGLTLGNPFETMSGRVSKTLLKACVVGLGFGMSLPAVLAVGRAGAGATALGIAFALGLGLVLSRLLRVEPTTGALISGGTAICGGSAIAALGPALGAGAEAMGVSLATVFLLNGVALYVFPAVGHALDLSQHQFALWAAIAIHDTSSVVGAAASYGPEALAEATVLKLTRALWIVPLALIAAWRRRRTVGGEVTVAFPWFIGLFALASAVVAAAPAWTPVYGALVALAKQGLVLTLFLIGAGLSRATLRTVGVRPLVHGVLLWAAVAGASLAAILWAT